MTQFIIFIRKEFYHIFRDRLTTLILLGLPILMLMLFGFAITTEIKNIPIAIYDPCPTAVSQRISHQLSANTYFILARWLHHPDEIELVFKQGIAKLVVVMNADNQIQLITDGSDPNTATTITQYATQIILSSQRKPLLTPLIIPKVKLLYNPRLKGAYNFVPGVMGMILMLICAMMTSIAIAREKEKGTMELLLVSPMKPIVIILSKAVPYFTISIINLANILLLSVFVLDVPIVGNLITLITISLLFIFVCLSLGLLISTVVSTQLSALLISGMALMAPIILLSGMMFPVENMPWFLQLLSNIIPARWYILAVKKIMIKGSGLDAILKETLILGSMAILFISLSLKKFKNRLE